MEKVTEPTYWRFRYYLFSVAAIFWFIYAAPVPRIPVADLIPVLQVAIGPAILISGVGLLLLTFTNRFARAVDRSRQLGRELRDASAEEKATLARQVEILYRRARLIRLSIIMGGSSVLLASVLIFVLFLTALLKLEVGLAITLLFAACLICLIISVATFIRDIQLSLKALKLELGLPEQN